MPGCAAQLSQSPVEVEPAPLPGQHNEVLYQQLLGLSREELAALKEEGVI